MNIQNTPTVNLQRLAEQQEERTRFYTDATEIGSPSSIRLESTGGDPNSTNSNFPMLNASVRPNRIPPAARARHTATVSTDGETDYRKINFNKQHIRSLRLILFLFYSYALY
jgi:hypothetical protein